MYTHSRKKQTWNVKRWILRSGNYYLASAKVLNQMQAFGPGAIFHASFCSFLSFPFSAILEIVRSFLRFCQENAHPSFFLLPSIRLVWERDSFPKTDTCSFLFFLPWADFASPFSSFFFFSSVTEWRLIQIYCRFQALAENKREGLDKFLPLSLKAKSIWPCQKQHLSC